MKRLAIELEAYLITCLRKTRATEASSYFGCVNCNTQMTLFIIDKPSGPGRVYVRTVCCRRLRESMHSSEYMIKVEYTQFLPDISLDYD